MFAAVGGCRQARLGAALDVVDPEVPLDVLPGLDDDARPVRRERRVAQAPLGLAERFHTGPVTAQLNEFRV